MPRGYQAPVGKFGNRQKDVARMLREKFELMKSLPKVPKPARDQYLSGGKKPG